mgnify:FL=1
MRDLLDIDAASGDVGSHQDIEVVLSESLHRPIALVLRHVALQRHCSMPIAIQLFCQLSSPALGTGEHDGRFEIVLLQELPQHLGLALLHDRVKSMLDGAGRYRVIDLDDEGIDQHLLGKSSNLAWHRCSKQQVLALFLEVPQDAFDVGKKSHVKHVVRFIQDESVDSGKIHISLAEQIEQSSGAGTDDIRSPLELLDLGLLRDTAVDGHGAKLGSSRQLSELFLDLGDQFSCRADHQHPWSWLISAQEVLDAGNRKCSGFPGSGLGEAEHISSLERWANGSGLDRSGSAVFGHFDRLVERLDQLELAETGDGGGIFLRHGRSPLGWTL